MLYVYCITTLCLSQNDATGNKDKPLYNKA
ncbi:hypothetical protein VPH5P1C_0155 [Vibrio phage 5P1c]